MFSKRFKDLSLAVSSCVYNEHLNEDEALNLAFELLEEVIQRCGIVYVLGNGGSAGIASHFAADLIKTLKIPSQTLYDSNLLTCLANDWGYETAFSYPLSKLLKPSDLLVAISSSGKSPSILNAVKEARTIGASVMTLSGFAQDNPLRQTGDLNFWIDQSEYGLVETAHFFLLHSMIDLWNKRPSPKKTYEVSTAK